MVAAILIGVNSSLLKRCNIIYQDAFEEFSIIGQMLLK